MDDNCEQRAHLHLLSNDHHSKQSEWVTAMDLNHGDVKSQSDSKSEGKSCRVFGGISPGHRELCVVTQEYLESQQVTDVDFRDEVKCGFATLHTQDDMMKQHVIMRGAD